VRWGCSARSSGRFDHQAAHTRVLMTIPPEIAAFNGSYLDAEPIEILRVPMCCDASAPRVARDAIRTLAAVELVRADAILVASELVSSVVIDAGRKPSEQIDLVVAMNSDALLLAITEVTSSAAAPLAARDPDYRGPRGLSRWIVETLTRRWGSNTRDGTVVWAELALEPDTSQPAGL
jgi:hypothetical protein